MPSFFRHGRAYRDLSCSVFLYLTRKWPLVPSLSPSSVILLPCALVSLSIKSDTPKSKLFYYPLLAKVSYYHYY